MFNPVKHMAYILTITLLVYPVIAVVLAVEFIVNGILWIIDELLLGHDFGEGYVCKRCGIIKQRVKKNK